MTVEERFWAKVERATEEGCWLWLGSTTGRKGYPPYGGFRITETRTIRAHRFAWELTYGPIPAGLLVCHECDVRLCVNPRHLFLGTHATNIADRDAKGRHHPARGIDQGSAKLDDAVIVAIRAATGTQREIAEQFGVHQSQVSRIKRGLAWAHV